MAKLIPHPVIHLGMSAEIPDLDGYLKSSLEEFNIVKTDLAILSTL
jgi:hypothetical protein